MTTKEATELGYTVGMDRIAEIVLKKDGEFVGSWWCHFFNYRKPDLDHWRIQEAVRENELRTV